ncbi:MAG: HYR domain-containing protein, partial [Flavobacteriales bacterium]|nr:HYR domain-containing protein [Flavobacteriales bacterium]
MNSLVHSTFSALLSQNKTFFKTCILLLAALFIVSNTAQAQTSWTEDASGYSIDLAGDKDGGHAFCDYDLDGDFDLVVNRTNRSYLYRNNGNGSFTDMTNGKAAGLTSAGRERCVVWGDLNNDGWPAFARNTHSGGIEVYLQNPTGNHKFGDGVGGNTPQTYNASQSGNFDLVDGVNTEGMGFMDYNGDGYLDIVFDNHNYGVDMLENDGTGYFFQVTAKDGSYDVNDPSTWPIGLVQDATDGDYYILQANYPNIAGEERLQINTEIRPADYPYQLYEIAPAPITNNAPIGQDDVIFYEENGIVSFDPLVDHGNGVDADPDGDALTILSSFGTAPTHGSAAVNADGTITYTPDTDFIGLDSLTYFLSDNPLYAASGLIDEVTVFIVWGGSDDNCVEAFNPFTWTQIPPNDDGSVGPLPLGFNFDLYGTTYTNVYINNNGNVSFDNPYWWYSSTGFPIGTPMVAPFWGDVDTRDWLANGYQGEVWYYQTATALYVTWVDAGTYSANNASVDDLGNTFTLVMTDGNDPALTPGNNVAFFYGDMQWTTGTASGGTNGFGGTPATVGINAGDNVNYILMGLFDSDTEDYDGPGGNNDGVNWLDDQCLEFDVSDAGNFPPVAQNFPSGNAINLCYGETQSYSFGFTGPETAETVSTIVNNGGWAGFTLDSNVDGNPSSIDFTITGDAVGSYNLSFSATDNNASPETTIINLTVNVIDCDCSAPPAVTCSSNITVNAGNGLCNANVSVPQPDINLACLGSTAIEFDGADDFVDVNDPIVTDEFSIEFWFKPASSNWDGVLFDMSEDAPLNGVAQRYFFIDASDSDIRWMFESQNDNDMQIDVAYDFSAIQWYHVTATGNFNSSGPHELYVDGVLIGTSNATVNGKPNSYESPRIGNFGSAYAVDQNAFEGTMDNFRIYDIQLNATQIDEVKCGNISNVASNITTFLDFEDGAGTSVGDVTAYGNNGLLTNMDPATAWVASDLTTGCVTIVNDYTGTASGIGNYPVGTTNIEWTVTAGNGGVTTCNQSVTVIDNQDPTISCAGNVTVGTDAGDCFATVSLTAPTTNDNCGVASVTNDAPATYPIGTTTVTWTVTDTAGRTATCSQNVTVADNENPTAVCQDVTVALDASGNATLTAADVDNGSSDNCGIASISIDETSFDCADLNGGLVVTSSNGYDVTINVNAVNINAASMSCAFGYSYTVDLDYDVTFSGTNIPANLYTLQGTLGCGANSQFFTLPNSGGIGTVTSANAYSNNTDCATATPASLDCNSISIQIEGPGISATTLPLLSGNLVTLTVTDNNGNTNTCTSNVTVEDNIAPTANCQNITVQLDASGQASITSADIDNGSSDNCGIATYSLSQSNFNCSDLGANTVTLTVEDASGNTDTCNATVTVQDNINPTISCSGNVTSNTNNAGCTGAVTISAPTTNDNCSVVTLTNNFNGTSNASDNYPVGTTTVVWTATDAAGNTATCSQTVTISSTLSANAGANFSFCEGETGTLSGAASGGNSPYTYSWDNGLGAGQNQNISPALSAYANESTTYVLTVADANGCTNTDAITITVMSNPDVAVSTVDATCGASNGSVTFTFANHPDRSSIEFSLDGGSSWETQVADNVGSVTYSLPGGTYNFATRWGNNECEIDLGSFTISDIDTTNPTISCPSNITASTASAGCTASVTVPVPSTNDNCSVASVINDFNGTGNASGTYPLGTTTVTWTVTDYNGNTAQCSMTVTVVDDVNPTISCASNVSVNTDSGDCFATVSLSNPTTNDNCGVASVTNNAPATYPVGTTTVVWTVTDNAGNTAQCSQIVTVTDDETPAITCEANLTQTADAGMCSAAITLDTPATTDNCSV